MNTSNIHECWRPLFSNLSTDEFLLFRKEISKKGTIYPKGREIFRVFEMPVSAIKAVVLGKNPLHAPRMALGYSYAVPEDFKQTQELKYIKEEIKRSLGKDYPDVGKFNTLEHWIEQGVFLLNTSLTVDIADASDTHHKHWVNFILSVIHYISIVNPCIWFSWNEETSYYLSRISKNPFKVIGYDLDTIKQIPSNIDYNYIFETPHTTPKGFKVQEESLVGSNHFLFANEILRKTKSTEILW